GKQQLLEPGEVRELATIGEGAPCLDRPSQAVLVGGEVLRQRPNAVVYPFLSLRCNSVAIAPAADDVVTLQGETGRIDPCVAARTCFCRTMLGELFADSRGATDIRLDGRHVRRRWWRGLAHDAVEHPRSAYHRACGCAIGGDLENTRMRENPAAMV